MNPCMPPLPADADSRQALQQVLAHLADACRTLTELLTCTTPAIEQEAPAPAAPESAAQAPKAGSDPIAANSWRAAVLVESVELKALVLGGLARAHMDAIWFEALDDLAAALKDGAFHAVVVEDVGLRLPLWLEAVQSAEGSRIPKIVIGDAGEDALFNALECGADDYCAANATAEAMGLRLSGQVRKFQATATKRMPLQGYTMDARDNTISNGSATTVLTAREFAIASALFERSGRVVDIETLASQGWGHSGDICKRRIEQHISNLRRKLPRSDSGALRINAVYGVGYRLDIDG
jgi:DNA-binding response OmpR family regulator